MRPSPRETWTRQGIAGCLLITLALALLLWFRSYLDTSRLSPSSLAVDTPRLQRPATTLPGDYTYISEDQHACERMYGTTYLTHAAEHQQPYCEPDSDSELQCFSASWDLGSRALMCVGRGVSYTNLSLTKHSVNLFNAHCRLRNFTAERESRSHSDELTALPTGKSPNPDEFQLLEDIRDFYDPTGVKNQLKLWDLDSRAPPCSKTENNGEWVLLVGREDNGNIWHKLMELWQLLVTVDILEIAVNPSTGQPWLSKEARKSLRIIVQDDREDVLDPWWSVINGSPNAIERLSAITPDTCFGNVVLPLAGSSSPFWSALIETNYHEPCQQSRILIDVFVRRMLGVMGVQRRAVDDVRKEPAITIIDRRSKRHLHDQERLAQLVRERYPESNVTIVDLAVMPMPEQVALMQDTDVLVGHYGAGLAHILFLPPGSAVVEISTLPAAQFRSLSNMRGIAHFHVRCIEAEMYALAVNGTPLPEGWRPGTKDDSWQEHEVVYLTDEDFLGYVEAAVKQQRRRRYDDRF